MGGLFSSENAPFLTEEEKAEALAKFEAELVEVAEVAEVGSDSEEDYTEDMSKKKRNTGQQDQVGDDPTKIKGKDRGGMFAWKKGDPITKTHGASSFHGSPRKKQGGAKYRKSKNKKSKNKKRKKKRTKKKRSRKRH